MLLSLIKDIVLPKIRTPRFLQNVSTPSPFLLTSGAFRGGCLGLPPVKILLLDCPDARAAASVTRERVSRVGPIPHPASQILGR